MYIKCLLYFFLTLKTSLKNPEPIFVLWKSSIRKRVETAVFKAWQEGAEIFLERSRFKSGISNDAMATLVVPTFWPPPGSDIFRIDAEFKDSMLFNFMLDTLNFFNFSSRFTKTCTFDLTRVLTQLIGTERKLRSRNCSQEKHKSRCKTEQECAHFLLLRLLNAYNSVQRSGGGSGGSALKSGAADSRAFTICALCMPWLAPFYAGPCVDDSSALRVVK